MRSLSAERLEKYLTVTDGSLDRALRLYEKNMRLSEAFYTPLQCMEVCLRNKIHTRLSDRYGDDWVDGNGLPFEADAIEQIAKAKSGTKKYSVSAGDIVAELHFGFWVGLLGPRYDATLWRATLHKAFLVGGGKKRSVVHGRFNALRRFRNRVAHHEPIIFHDLKLAHDEIIESLGWMCAETAAWANHLSSFPEAIADR